jgi:hypothetical protein
LPLTGESLLALEPMLCLWCVDTSSAEIRCVKAVEESAFSVVGADASEDGGVCVVEEAEASELGVDVKAATLAVGGVEGGTRGGEADAGRLLAKMITLYTVSFVESFTYGDCGYVKCATLQHT